MSDARKGMSSSPAPPATPANTKKSGASGTPKIKTDEEGTIKVASKKDGKDSKDSKDGGSASKSSGIIKLKKPPPKHKQPGNWKEGTFVDRKSDPSLTLSFCFDALN